MPSLDANLLLRWLLDDVPEQSTAVGELLDSGVPCHVADVALIEVAFVLERVMHIPRELVGDSLSAILSHGSIRTDRPVWTASVADYLEHPKLSIADCFLAEKASATGHAPLYTFDRKLAQQLHSAELLTV